LIRGRDKEIKRDNECVREKDNVLVNNVSLKIDHWDIRFTVARVKGGAGQ
jgi:hypothetical protein